MNPRLIQVLAVVLICVSSIIRTHAANGDDFPTPIRLGIYLSELEDFDTQTQSFTADFWIWGLTPPSHKNWIQTLDYPNSINVETSQVSEQLVDGLLWSHAHVSGEFRVAWDLKNYPFDKRELVIPIEESFLETAKVLFEADAANSNADEAIVPEGWRISHFTIKTIPKKYSTAFGDPSKPPKSSSEYARLEIRIGVERNSYAVFWKLTAIPYIATILAFLSFFVVFDSFLMFPRFSLLIGSLFAACLSLKGLNSELGSTDIFTLMDSIHLATLVYVLFAILCAIGSREMFKRSVPEQKILFWNIFVGTVSLVIFAALNVVLVWNAMNS